MQRLFCFSLALLLAACASAPVDNGNLPAENFRRDGIDHNRETAEKFINRQLDFRAGLINYVDPRRATLKSRELSGESIVFRLDNTGDVRGLHEAALERAAELAIQLSWNDAQIESENATEGHIAYVKIESLGMPAGATRGSNLPVKITCVGNASEIRGGYLYPTPIKNKLGRTIGVWEGGYLPAAGELPGERDGRPVKNPLIDARTGEQAKDETGKLLWEEAFERRQNLGNVSYILREGFKVAATVPADELSAEQIELPMDRIINEQEGTRSYPVSADMLPEIIAGVEEGMKARGLPCKAEAEGTRKLIVTPLGVREKTLMQVFEELQSISITFKPKNALVIVFDDERQRVVLYGPLVRRFLIADVQLGTDPLTIGTEDPVTGKPRKPEPLLFRVSCRLIAKAKPGKSGKYGVPDKDDVKAGIKPDGDKGKVHLSWKLEDKDGGTEREGEADLDSCDLADVLRFLWVKGMGPREVVGFCIVAKDKPAIIAELGFNPKRVKFDDKGE